MLIYYTNQLQIKKQISIVFSKFLTLNTNAQTDTFLLNMIKCIGNENISFLYILAKVGEKIYQ